MAKKGKKIGQSYWMWFYALLAILLIGWSMMSNFAAPVQISWDIVKNDLIASNDVSKVVVVNDKIANVYLTDEAIKKYSGKSEYKNIPQTTDQPQFIFRIGSLEKFQNDFERAQENHVSIPLEFREEKSFWSDFSGLIPILLIVVVWIFIMRRMSRGGGSGGGGNVFNVGKAKAQIYDKDSANKITFKDVAGLSEVKVEIMEIVDFLRNPKKYSDLGGKIPKGALLIGPPGTGKTLLAKAVAGEADVPFFSISGSDFVEMFVGVGASRVRDLFKQAKEKAPCIVFIDEIDAIGRARSKNGGYSSNDERENTLNQLLTEMDGFGTNSGVILLAATNRADILDKALMRAGRFDRQINVELPNQQEREEIIEVHIRNLKLGNDFDKAFFAKQTPGFSGADIANVCNEAALIAARKNKKMIEKQDFLDAIDRIIGGLERKSKVITPVEKRTIAYHEAGHATVSWLLEYANPLIKVTIVPRGRALGAAWYLPEERQITTKEQLIHEMAAILGGRAAEELIFNEVSTGALNDLERVTKQAYAMIAYYGMGKSVGNTSYYNSSGGDMFTKPYSETTSQSIDQEVMELIESAYKRAKEILITQSEGHKELAELLLVKEVVFAEDLERIFGKRKGKTIGEEVMDNSSETLLTPKEEKTDHTTIDEPTVK